MRIFICTVIINVLILYQFLFAYPLRAEDDFASYITLFPEWDLRASNTVKFEHYENFGNAAASPHAFEEGQFYDNLILDARRRYSTYENMRFQFSGVANASDYRSTEAGLVPERISFKWEKGDTDIPFRLDAGDIFAFQSLRTIQRSLKGTQIEIQPTWGEYYINHSIQLFSGISGSDYRDLDVQKDIYSGASWLIENEDIGAFSINASHNFREENDLFFRPQRQQSIFSVATELPFDLMAQDFIFEAEHARFFGDHGNGFTLADTEDKHDVGYYANLQGKSHDMPLNYNLSFEEYGEDYRPRGASITPDQRAIKSNATWRFEDGIRLKGRVQYFRDLLKSTNPVDTITTGINVSGPVTAYLPKGSTVGFDAFIQDRENKTQSTDRLTQSATAQLAFPIKEKWTGNLTLQGIHTDNQNNSPSTITRQMITRVSHDFTWEDIKGVISPSLSLRHINLGNGIHATSINPALSLGMKKDAHVLQFSHNYLSQDPNSSSSADLNLLRTALNYKYSEDSSEYGIEASSYDRDPDELEDTHAYKVGVYWTFRFNRPAKVPSPPTSSSISYASTPSIDMGQVGLPDIMDLRPGMLLSEAQQWLANNNIKNPQKAAGIYLYIADLLESINQRQRLVLTYNDSRVLSETTPLMKAILIVYFDDVNDVSATARTFARVQELLLKRYGNPDTLISEGEFTTNISEAVNNGTLKRVMEWDSDAGIVRFGIPKRTDGLVRMEITHARKLSEIDRNDWSIFEVR